jgi:putative heme-binding domain-containing protein
MLRPAVQPGSKIDYRWHEEVVTVEFRSTADFSLKAPGKVAPATIEKDGRRVIRVALKAVADSPMPFEVILPTGNAPSLSVSYHTNEDPRPRALQLIRFLVPWAALKKDAALVMADIPELKGGDWEIGRRVFFSDEAGCSRCHTVKGQGGQIGPDLSNLIHRDYASVLRDIAQPSYALHPDYITQVIELKDGRVLTGAVRTEGDKLHVGDAKGQELTVRRDQVNEMLSSPVSIMPEGLPQLLGTERMRDLMTFLLTEEPRKANRLRKLPGRAPKNRQLTQPVRPFDLTSQAGSLK